MGLIVRGTCPACKRRRRVRKDGLIRVHYERDGFDPEPPGYFGDYNVSNPLCPGSGHRPVESDTGQYFCNTGCSGCRDVIEYGI